MLYYWGISLALCEILPELAFVLIPIGLLFYLLTYWHVILVGTVIVYMWVNFDSLHWWRTAVVRTRMPGVVEHRRRRAEE